METHGMSIFKGEERKKRQEFSYQMIKGNQKEFMETKDKRI